MAGPLGLGLWVGKNRGSRNWTQQTKAFLDASGIKNDSTVYFSATAYSQTGSEIWHSVDRFVRGLINDGLWAKLISLTPFIGETYAQAKFNLVNPLDTDLAHRVLQVGTPGFSGIGVTFNGEDNYLRSNVIPSAQGAYNNFSIGSCVNTTSTSGRDLYGVRQGDNKRLELVVTNGYYTLADIPGYLNRIVVAPPNNGEGLWLFWIEDNKVKWTVEGIDQVGINLGVVTMPDKEIYLGACNNDGSVTGKNAGNLLIWYYGIDFDTEDNYNLGIRINRFLIDLKRIAV